MVLKDYAFFSGPLKQRCGCRFQRVFTACMCVFKEITLNQGNYFETHMHAINARWKRLSQRSLTRGVIWSYSLMGPNRRWMLELNQYFIFKFCFIRIVLKIREKEKRERELQVIIHISPFFCVTLVTLVTVTTYIFWKLFSWLLFANTSCP